ncbi:hypothetical protein [Arthrobacter sp. ISL-5]|nr:hypothetical protein [Arthrobacter sp. ISL-5]
MSLSTDHTTDATKKSVNEWAAVLLLPQSVQVMLPAAYKTMKE